MKFYFIILLVVQLAVCIKRKEPSTPDFNTYRYLQLGSCNADVQVDTIFTGFSSDTDFVLQFYFRHDCKNLFKIEKMRRVKSTDNDSIIKERTANIQYGGLDGLEESGSYKKIRHNYYVMFCHDSTIYHLSCLVPLSTTRETAENNLLFLKKILTCNNETCARDYIDSLKLLCVQSMTESDRLQQR